MVVKCACKPHVACHLPHAASQRTKIACHMSVLNAFYFILNTIFYLLYSLLLAYRISFAFVAHFFLFFFLKIFLTCAPTLMSFNFSQVCGRPTRVGVSALMCARAKKCWTIKVCVCMRVFVRNLLSIRFNAA